MTGRTDGGTRPLTGTGADPHPDIRSHLRDEVPPGPPAGPPPGAFDGPDVAPAPPTTGPPGAFDGPPAPPPGPTGPPADAPADPAPTGRAQHPDGTDPDPADPRWARLAGDFVDEPQQAVDAARRMVRDAVEALLADVDPGVDGAGGATRAPDGAGSDTERLRQAFRRYRDLHTAVARL